MVGVVIVEPGELLPAQSRAAEALVRDAFGANFRTHDWIHGIDGVHVLVTDDGALIAHAAVVPRTLWHGVHEFSTGHVESVAVRADQQGRRLGRVIMDHAELRPSSASATISAHSTPPTPPPSSTPPVTGNNGPSPPQHAAPPARSTCTTTKIASSCSTPSPRLTPGSQQVRSPATAAPRISGGSHHRCSPTKPIASRRDNYRRKHLCCTLFRYR